MDLNNLTVEQVLVILGVLALLVIGAGVLMAVVGALFAGTRTTPRTPPPTPPRTPPPAARPAAQPPAQPARRLRIDRITPGTIQAVNWSQAGIPPEWGQRVTLPVSQRPTNQTNCPAGCPELIIHSFVNTGWVRCQNPACGKLTHQHCYQNLVEVGRPACPRCGSTHGMRPLRLVH